MNTGATATAEAIAAATGVEMTAVEETGVGMTEVIVGVATVALLTAAHLTAGIEVIKAATAEIAVATEVTVVTASANRLRLFDQRWTLKHVKTVKNVKSHTWAPF
jgi:hypothetical protein